MKRIALTVFLTIFSLRLPVFAQRGASAEFRSGNFSSLLPGTVITDPPTGAPFPGNIIPISRKSPAAQALLKFSPLPDPDGFHTLHFPIPGRHQRLRGSRRLPALGEAQLSRAAASNRIF